jgi:hypothetical protein
MMIGFRHFAIIHQGTDRRFAFSHPEHNLESAYGSINRKPALPVIQSLRMQPSRLRRNH